MKFSSEFLDTVKSRVDIINLIDRTVPLKKSGRNNYEACCPFPGHDEKTPSFKVNEADQFYHCFGCGANGDAIKWLTDHEGLSFPDAVKSLASIAGVELPKDESENNKADERSKAAFSLGFRMQRTLAGDLKNNPIKLPFQGDIIDTLQLGRPISIPDIKRLVNSYQKALPNAELQRLHKQIDAMGTKAITAPLTTRKGAVTGFVLFDHRLRPEVLSIHPSYDPAAQWLNNHALKNDQTTYVTYDLPSFARASQFNGNSVLEPHSKTQLSDEQYNGVQLKSANVVFVMPDASQRKAAALFSLIKHWEPGTMTRVLDANEAQPSQATLFDYLVNTWTSYEPEHQEKLSEILHYKDLSVIHHIASTQQANITSIADTEPADTLHQRFGK